MSRNPRSRCQDTHEIERVDGVHVHEPSGPLLPPHASKRVDCVRERVLLARKAGDEAPATHHTAGLATAQRAKHVAPRRSTSASRSARA